MGALRGEVLVCGDDDEVRRELNLKGGGGRDGVGSPGTWRIDPGCRIAAVEA